MVKMAQDTTVGAIKNFFNLCTMWMPIAEIADCKLIHIVPEYD